VESEGTVKDQLARLSYTPDIYSPNWQLLSAADVHELQSQGIRVIPWTVNDTLDLYKVMQMGVDGIITDFPDRLYAMRD
jgi:glycerophosphoryl diester phosphodiesterase